MNMITFYKAVRPDGTSFYDRTTRWKVGEVTRHPRRGAIAARGDAANYLSVSTVPTDCTGFQWPARLLVVTLAKGHPAFWAPDPLGLPNKRASTAWRVVGERPALELFGPQGEHLVALIERAARLSGDEVEQLYSDRSAAWYAAWDASGYADRNAAWGAARNAARHARDAAWDAAQDAARDAAWDAAQDAAWGAVRDAARNAARPAAQDAAWGAACAAARDAAWALLVRDSLDTDHYQALTAPWARVIGKVHPDDPPAAQTTITKE